MKGVRLIPDVPGTVPPGCTRVLLVGGVRHGQWCNVSDTEPESVDVSLPQSELFARASRGIFDNVATPQIVEVPVEDSERYWRAVYHGTDEDGTAVVLSGVYVRWVGMEGDAVTSAMHLASCNRWACAAPQHHTDRWREYTAPPLTVPAVADRRTTPMKETNVSISPEEEVICQGSATELLSAHGWSPGQVSYGDAAAWVAERPELTNPDLTGRIWDLVQLVQNEPARVAVDYTVDP